MGGSHSYSHATREDKTNLPSTSANPADLAGCLLAPPASQPAMHTWQENILWLTARCQNPANIIFFSQKNTIPFDMSKLLVALYFKTSKRIIGILQNKLPAVQFISRANSACRVLCWPGWLFFRFDEQDLLTSSSSFLWLHFYMVAFAREFRLDPRLLRIELLLLLLPEFISRSHGFIVLLAFCFAAWNRGR